MDEIIGIVDENNNVVGKAPRKEVREKNLPHRSTAILVKNSNGQILVHQRTKTKDVYPGMYDMLIGGTVDYGEEYLENAQREIMEEIGADTELKFLFDHKFGGVKENVFIRVFETEFDGPLKLQKEEVVWAEFVSVEKLNEMLKIKEFCPDSLEIYEKIGEM